MANSKNKPRSASHRSPTRSGGSGGDGPLVRRPNKTIRMIVPIVLFLGAVGVAAAVWTNTTRQPSRQTPAADRSRQIDATPAPAPAPAPTTAATTPASDPAPDTGAAPQRERSAEAPVPVQAEAPAPPVAPGNPVMSAADDDDTAPAPEPATAPTPAASTAGAPLGDLRAERFEPTPITDAWDAPTLGRLKTDDTPSPYAAKVVFSPVGAGVRELRLSNYFETIAREEHALVMAERIFPAGRLTPMAVLGVQVNGQWVSLTGYTNGQPDRIWRTINAPGGEPIPGAFEAFVVNEAGERLLRVERRYALAEASHDLRVRQNLENLSGRPLRVRLYQAGPADLRQESHYGGDKRRVRFGYFLDQLRDPSQTFVQADQRLAGRGSLLGPKTDGAYDAERQVWPSPRSIDNAWTLVWTAFTNRYFAVAVHPLLPDSPEGAPPPPPSALSVFERIDRVLADRINGEGMMLRLVTPERALEPGGAMDFSHGVYAGPLSHQIIASDKALSSLRLGGLVVYNLGGPCAACTFAWLADTLHAVLLFAHDYLVFDWALAIILLVIVVRTVLHPITRWSQIRMQRFGKQMQELAPKQSKLKERFKDDPKRMQQEMAKLWREEGVNPAGMLGCLPMFLQTPVWIALYATLYYSFEMRHAPAFFGIFQSLTGGSWPFLADLAKPDTLIPFPGALDLGIVRIDSFNILPLVLGFVFYLHQKYLTPPTTVAMTPEQQSQQRMIRVMTVVLFPIIMYGAPSGLALYFVTNSVVAIFENRWIRASAEKKGLLDIKPKKKAAKPGGFLARLYEAAAEAQKRRETEQAGPGRAQTRAMQDGARQRGPRNLPQPKRKKRK